MRCLKSYAAAVGAAAATLAVFMGSASAGVVLGNLGSTGATALGGIATTIVAPDFAVSFTTGTDVNFLNLTDVTVGLSSPDGTQNVAAILYSDLSGSPNSPLAWTNTQSVGTTATKVTFAAPELSLSPSTTYWMVLDAANTLSWWSPSTTPTAFQSSGWSYGTSQQNPGSGWVELGDTRSVSFAAVPEPESLTVLATAAVAIAGGIFRRRRAVA